MKAQRTTLAAAATLFRVATAVLQSVPTLIMSSHLFAAPFGAQLDNDFDSAAASWPSPCFDAELRALDGQPPGTGRSSEIRAARLSALRPPPGESS
jgi:hypothetical protein